MAVVDLVSDGLTDNQKLIIDMLEATKEECRQGEVQGFYMVLDRGNGSWAEKSTGGDSLRVLGILTAMHEQMLRAVLSE